MKRFTEGFSGAMVDVLKRNTTISQIFDLDAMYFGVGISSWEQHGATTWEDISHFPDMTLQRYRG